MAEVYSIQEMAAEVGGDLTPRTIRYYIAEGLLPKPDERGQYTQTHLQRLLLIRRYREAFVPLDRIRAQLITLSEDEVAEALQESSPPALVADSAADYTARLLAGYANRPQEPTAPARKTARADAVPDLQETLALHRRLKAPVSQTQASPARPQAETWERSELIPGVELHARRPRTPETEAFLQKLLTYAETLKRPTP